MLSIETYEVLHIDKDDFDYTYYIRYYPDSMECKGINMRLNEDQFESFTTNKLEV